MAALNFPASPALNDTYSANNNSWRWNGTSWVTINSFAAGSAAAPSITATGDTNTGIFFPEADSIAISSNGFESMRVGGIGFGTVGIGMAPASVNALSISSIYGPQYGGNQLAIYGQFVDPDGPASAGITLIADNTTLNFFASDSSSLTGLLNPGLRDMTFGTNNLERMRIHQAGGVSIGTTTAPGNTNLLVQGTGTFGGNISASASSATAVEGVFTNTSAGVSSSAGIRGIANSTGYYLLRQYSTGVTATVFGQTLANYALLASDGASSNGLMLGSLTADPVIFGTNNLERMRVHSSGGVSIGNTTDSGAANLNVSGVINGGYAALAAGTTAMAFNADNVVRVTPNASATYTSTVPAAGAICVLSILTSGVTSYTITFGTGFKSTGTLATGTTTARYFNITFVSDGTNLIETSRTVAIA
jgi:hypothetical protein